ncbi:FIBA2-like protein [Mya arenaria]|uniref:FIBA2-like protein n=1 Tax=Mya arenaria TaxID=6604 RepID=A0ABY7EML0_MYAAR|nr:FIBA2-like protein [Mya arenaria]
MRKRKQDDTQQKACKKCGIYNVNKRGLMLKIAAYIRVLVHPSYQKRGCLLAEPFGKVQNRIKMVWLHLFVVVVTLTIPTCVGDRLARMERQIQLWKGFQYYVQLRLDTIERDFGALSQRVSNLESLVKSSNNNTGGTDNPTIGHTKGTINTQSAFNGIKTTLQMYRHSFQKQKQELVNVNYDVKDTLSAFLSNASKTVDTLVNTLSDHNVYATRAHVQNETIQLEKKVEELICRANEIVGIIDEQRSTIEDGIMVTIRALHISWSDWSAWSDCSQSCDKGRRSRQRSCYVPPPFTDGICIGDDTETEDCVIREWMVNGLCGRHKAPVLCPVVTAWRPETDPAPIQDLLMAGWCARDKTLKKNNVTCSSLSNVFQRRVDGSVEFNRGLDLLYSIASRAKMTLRIDLRLLDGTTGFDEYSGFYISPPEQYNFNVDRRINSAGMSGSYLLSDIGDYRDINHQPFSTYDSDVDKWLYGNCARYYGGGWWYNRCAHSYLNEQYNTGGYYYSFQRYTTLKTSTMMLRLSN